MKFSITYCFFLCLFCLFRASPSNLNLISNLNQKYFKQQPPNLLKSSVKLDRYSSSSFENKNNYLRFTMSNQMFNHWLILLKNLGAKPSDENKLNFYRL